MVAFVAGLALATPPVEYLAAMIAILASGAPATEQFAAALMFTLVAFTVAEITHQLSPPNASEDGNTVVLRLHDWLSARRPAHPRRRCCPRRIRCLTRDYRHGRCCLLANRLAIVAAIQTATLAISVPRGWWRGGSPHNDIQVLDDIRSDRDGVRAFTIAVRRR